MANINVIAIHGTFAKEAIWPRRGGILHQALIKRLPHHAINWIEPNFLWSEANSHQAREKAALKLQRIIASLPNPSNNEFNVLIGHSHGGNIALMSLCLSHESRKMISAVVCLSTPFIVATKRSNFFRELASTVFVEDQIIPTILFLIVIAFLSFTAGGALAGGMFLTFLAVTSFWALVVRHLELPGSAQSVLSYYRFSDLSTPILSMRTTFDEALSWVRAWSYVAGVGFAIKLLLWVAILITLIFPYVAFFGFPLWLAMDIQLGDSIGMAMYFAGLAMVLLPFVFFGADMFRALVRSSFFSFGEDPIVGLAVSFKSVAKLEGVPNFREHTVQPGLRFNHSHLPSDPRTAGPIAELIQMLSSRAAT